MARSWTLVPTPIFSVEPIEDGDPPGAAGGEQLGLVPVGLGVVDEPDRLAGQAAGDELVAQLVVDVPAGAGGAQVAEHQLQRSAHRVRRCRRGRGTRRRGAPARWRRSGRRRRRSCRRRSAAGRRSRRSSAARRPSPEILSMLSSSGPTARLRTWRRGRRGRARSRAVLGRLDGRRFPARLAVGARLRSRDGQGQVVGGLDVGGDVQHAQHLGDVGEPGEPGLHPEVAAAFGGQLDLGDDLAEGGRPGVEDLDARGLAAGPGAGSAASRTPR